MIRKAIGDVWKILPWRVRAKIVRLTQPKFTVSAAAVIINMEREVLLLDHVLRPLSGWGLPGGFLKKGEQPDEGIRREIREEIGLELDSLAMYRVRTVGSHIEMIFTARPSGEPKVNSREILGLGWFTTASMPANLSIAQRNIIDKVLSDSV
jgi:8-oxo-dGTP diphosphatase